MFTMQLKSYDFIYNDVYINLIHMFLDIFHLELHFTVNFVQHVQCMKFILVPKVLLVTYENRMLSTTCIMSEAGAFWVIAYTYMYTTLYSFLQIC